MSCNYIARSTAIAARKLGDEMVVISAIDSSLYTLNEQATAIWEAADGVTPLSEIVEQAICRRYEVSPEQARRDAEELVMGLSAHGILLICDEPILVVK